MKTNREEYIQLVSLIAIFILFWGLIICGIFGDTNYVAPILIGLYSVSVGAFLIYAVKWETENAVKNFLKGFIIMELFQIIPYIAVLAIRNLIL